MRKALLAAVTGLVCAGILAGVLVAHAYPLWVGKEITLRVVRPIDPRDLFRGEYVILSYDLSRLRLEAGEADEAAATQTAQATPHPASRTNETVQVLGDWLKEGEEKAWVDKDHFRYRWRSDLEQTLRDRTLYVQLEPCAANGETEAVAMYAAVSVSDQPVEGKMN